MPRPKNPQSYPTVDDVQRLESRGPWDTKSGGQLSVLFSLPLDSLGNNFFAYADDELAVMPSDIRGLRAYRVDTLPKDSVGGNEWHRIRSELVFALDGLVRWQCEDVHGGQRDILLDGKTGVQMPPYILHTYRTVIEGAGLLIVANTSFDPNDPRTHDTYSLAAFRELQEQVPKAQ